MPTIDDFEDQNWEDEYAMADGSNSVGNNIIFSDTVVYEGTWSMGTSSGNWTNLISHPDNANLSSYLPNYPVRGDTVTWYSWVDSESSNRIQIGVQDTTTRNNCYAIELSNRSGDDFLELDVRSGGSAVQTVTETNIGIPAETWTEIAIDWVDDGSGNSDLSVTVTDLSTDSTVTTTSLLDTDHNYTDGGVGWGFVGDSSTATNYVDYLHIADGTVTVSGTFTYNGTGTSGATVRGINDTQGVHQGTDTTASDGSYSIDFPTGDEGHFLLEYQDPDTGDPVTVESKPFIATQ